MNRPSDDFLRAIAKLRDVNKYNGPLNLELAEGVPREAKIPRPPMVMIFPNAAERRQADAVDLTAMK